MNKGSQRQIVQSLLKFMDQAYDKKAWHGPTLRGSVRGVTHKDALWRPSPKHHNIWEIVLHAAYWKYAVRRRLAGDKRGSFPRKGSNWLSSPAGGDAVAWKKDVALMQEQHDLLRTTVAGISPAKLSKMANIYGIAAHDLYHAGQIQLLKRLQRGGVVKTS